MLNPLRTERLWLPINPAVLLEGSAVEMGNSGMLLEKDKNLSPWSLFVVKLIWHHYVVREETVS